MFKIKLELDGRQYVVENFNYSIGRYYGEDTDSNADLANISLSIRVEKLDQTFLNWCEKGDKQRKNGKFAVLDLEKETTVQTINFEQGYCSALSGSVYPNDSYNGNPVMSFTIAAKTLTVKLSKEQGKRASDEA